MRGFAAILAVVALAGQLASFAHLVLVRHVTCAEHGELVEIGRDQSTVAVRSQRPAASTVGDASQTETHGHEHCLLAPMRRDRLAASATAAFDVARFDTDPTISRAPDVAVSPAVAVIVFAPKNSPPHA
ncbi:MAG TPA: hypothetical protein VHV78_10150 [Gemmatimonadaceae bacterium]|jgi:hypothetical protein|nr:hypothetical protein [Gemmatimonadaceae bacterium]